MCPPEQALESVVRYLAAAGRDGQHYVEALELMNKAQDETKGREDSQVAAPGQPLPTQPIDFGQDSSSSQDGVTAASCAAWNTEGHFETATLEQVTACLDTGVDLEVRNDSGFAPLHLAASRTENPAVIEALLDAGADLEARDREQGATPLGLAAGNNENLAVIEVLLAAGAKRLGISRTSVIRWLGPPKGS